MATGASLLPAMRVRQGAASFSAKATGDIKKRTDVCGHVGTALCRLGIHCVSMKAYVAGNCSGHGECIACDDMQPHKASFELFREKVRDGVTGPCDLCSRPLDVFASNGLAGYSGALFP